MPATVVSAKDNEQAYIAAFERRRGELPGLQRIREAAMERFGVLGFPTTHNEEWKYTNLAPFLKSGYEPAQAYAGEANRGQATKFRESGEIRARPRFAQLTFVNGRFAPELSSSETVRGLKLSSLGEAIRQGRLADRIARQAAFENNAMVALNTAMFEDGALVEIADGAVLDEPIELRFLTRGERPVMTFPRNLILAGRDSQAQIIEVYEGSDGAGYFTNAVTEIDAADGSVVEHYKVQRELEASLHFGMLAVRQGGSSNFTSHNVALGAALARNEIAVVLDGEGSECTLNGLYVTTGRQHVDNYTTLDHAKPHSTSHELYKGILDGKSQAVFHGRIIVRQDAQKTDAIQRNKNLLLSEGAVINTKPQLEIYADDVKCTHGATVGQVDPDAVFYLRSRGIALQEARALLTYAFTADVLGRIKIESIRAGLGDELFRRLAGTGSNEL
jgi:Fe-S cluster assembly protein SufD